jgi:hypothetical protein
VETIQVKVKCCSLSHRTFSQDMTTVSMDNPLHGGQSNPGPRELLDQVETLEGSETPLGLPHIESTAIIVYKIYNRFARRVSTLLIAVLAVEQCPSDGRNELGELRFLHIVSSARLD